jgi:hypothetical protein
MRACRGSTGITPLILNLSIDGGERLYYLIIDMLYLLCFFNGILLTFCLLFLTLLASPLLKYTELLIIFGNGVRHVAQTIKNSG